MLIVKSDNPVYFGVVGIGGLSAYAFFYIISKWFGDDANETTKVG